MILLKQNVLNTIQEMIENDPTQIELYTEEKAYAEKHQLIPTGVQVIEKDNRFKEAYIERCEKETVNLMIVETAIFLEGKIEHLQTHLREFIYIEDASLDLIGIDALSLEVDDVFSTHTALFGLKMKQKNEAAIKNYLEANLKDERGKFSVSFSGQDGLWNMNLAINCMEGFRTDMTLREASELVYAFMFKMIETIEETI